MVSLYPTTDTSMRWRVRHNKKLWHGRLGRQEWSDRTVQTYLTHQAPQQESHILNGFGLSLPCPAHLLPLHKPRPVAHKFCA